VITQQDLDALWNFDDPRGSEQRLRNAAEADRDNADELLTQVARALGLQESYDAARELLDQIEDDQLPPATRVRIALERGRVENSAGHPEVALPLFDAARALADEHGLEFLHIDALHMLAITDREREAHWTAEAVLAAGAATDDRTRRWLVALHNNHGWTFYDDGDFLGATAEFERALEWAENIGSEAQQRYAREALDEARAAASRQSGWTGP
jgi:tetratricopeptide (TPR) repeat protein